MGLAGVTPGVRAETHEYISTGQADSKFGFGIGHGVASAAVERAAAMSSVELVGIHCHIGSQGVSGGEPGKGARCRR